jgi:NAD(P)-dependent dehydrogenase (short-subunit alcohol dehydrogenase family)
MCRQEVFMAVILPDHPEPEHDSERRVLTRLRELDDDWLVFHNIKWQALRRNRQGDGETDFALFHPTKGIFVVEGKGGDVIIEDGQYKRRHARGALEDIGSPFDQAEACKRQLSDFLAAEINGLAHGPRVGRAVAFPHVRIEGDLGPAGPRAIIVDAGDLAMVGRTIQRLVDYWKPSQQLSPAQLARIRKLLLPSVTVRRLLREEVADAGEAIVELTKEQFEVLDAIGGNRQAFITGGAGTGKTVLAIERARRLADLGATVLLVCFNRLLGEALRAEFTSQPNVIAGNLHRVVRQILVDAHHLVPDDPGQEWWDTEAIALFPEAAADLGFEVDAVIIDEAQDFHPHWWDPLKLVMRDFHDGWLYVFADEQQALYTEGWSPPFDTHAFTYRLTRNCRNTDPIATKVSAVFGGSSQARGVPGPKPRFLVVKNAEDATAKILARLDELLVEGITPAQIQVLATGRELVTRLRGEDVNGIGLVEAGGDGIAVETVHRFKGLEAPVVLLAIVDPNSDVDGALAYTGLSRAQTMLEVFGTAETRVGIHWDGGG